MAGAPCPLPHALHANLLVMDELGGAVLRRSDGLHQREELCLDARTGRCDHHLLGGPQRQSSARGRPRAKISCAKSTPPDARSPLALPNTTLFPIHHTSDSDAINVA